MNTTSFWLHRYFNSAYDLKQFAWTCREACHTFHIIHYLPCWSNWKEIGSSYVHLLLFSRKSPVVLHARKDTVNLNCFLRTPCALTIDCKLIVPSFPTDNLHSTHWKSQNCLLDWQRAKHLFSIDVFSNTKKNEIMLQQWHVDSSVEKKYRRNTKQKACCLPSVEFQFVSCSTPHF